MRRVCDASSVCDPAFGGRHSPTVAIPPESVTWTSSVTPSPVKVTIAPGTVLPSKSRSITEGRTGTGSPRMTVWLLPATISIDHGSPATAVASMVTGGMPTTVATTVFGPAIRPSRQLITPAIPSLFVTAESPRRTPLPRSIAKSTGTPASGFPRASRTVTDGEGTTTVFTLDDSGRMTFDTTSAAAGGAVLSSHPHIVTIRQIDMPDRRRAEQFMRGIKTMMFNHSARRARWRRDEVRLVTFSMHRVVGIALLVVVGCDSPTPPGTFENLRILPESPNLLTGTGIRLVPFSLAGTRHLDGSITWSTSDPGVVAVDSTGLITGVATGMARIRATSRDGFAETVVAVAGSPGSVRAGGATACGIVASTSKLYCWGLNERGEAGIGDTVSVVREPRETVGNLLFSSVSLSNWHGCGTTTAGLHCWGMNHRGQLGIGSDGPVSRSPVPVSGGTPFVAVSVASSAIDDPVGITCLEFGCSSRTCALGPDGTPYCWGNFNPTPTPLGITNRFRSIEIHLQYTCGIDSSHVPHCWGGGRHNQAPRTLIGGTEAPPVPGNYRFQAMSGSAHVCGLDLDGVVHCWGANTSGQLGSPSGTEYCMPFLGARDACRAEPEAVETDYRFLTISTGGAHTCGIATTLEVVCWGSNGSGQLGTGSGAPTATQVPVPVISSLRFRSVSAGSGFTCAVALDGDAYCWGANNSGQLGNGATAASSIPVRVSGNLKFR